MYAKDYEVFHHFTSTHPRSPFVERLIVMRLDPGLSRKLLGRELTVEKPDGTKETSTIEAERLDVTLKDLGILLTEDELTRLLAIY